MLLVELHVVRHCSFIVSSFDLRENLDFYVH
jgi:hypothetical protein